jgi:hypothetical protein
MKTSHSHNPINSITILPHNEQFWNDYFSTSARVLKQTTPAFHREWFTVTTPVHLTVIQGSTGPE